MAHRDDHEAARNRIHALERELDEARTRAREAEERARELETPDVHPSRTSDPPARTPRSTDARWPTALQRRFGIGAAIAVVAADLPVVALFASGSWFLDDADDSVLLYSLVPVLMVTPVVYVLATLNRAPFPSSAMLSSILAGAMGWFAVIASSSDMLWGEVLGELPPRGIVRGASGLLAIAFHALVVAHWCAEAALAETSSTD